MKDIIFTVSCKDTFFKYWLIFQMKNTTTNITRLVPLDINCVIFLHAFLKFEIYFYHFLTFV